jgi:hypothetical protein
MICGYLEPLFDLLEVSDQSSALLFYLICDYLMIVLVPQTVYSRMRGQLAISELERWEEVGIGKYEALSLYLLRVTEESLKITFNVASFSCQGTFQV